MKKHYRGLAVALSACMIAGGGFTAYAAPTGPGSDPSLTPGANAEQLNQTDEQQVEENTAFHVAVNYQYNGQGDVTALSMDLRNFEGIGGVSYRANTNTGGFLWWYHDGLPTGLPGDGSYIQALQIQLTGQAERLYDIYYSVTTSGQGKMAYAKNGELAGTTGLGEKLLSVDVVLVPKGGAAPVAEGLRYRSEITDRLAFLQEGTFMTNEDGTPYNGWLTYDSNRFYFNNGVAMTGWQYIDGLKFYFDIYGVLSQDVDALIGKQGSYLLKVNKTLNCLTVYAQDGSNGYIIPVKAMLTSVGDDTPIGTFKTPAKYRWRLMVNDTYTQYATRITQGFLLHSITYATPNENDLLSVGYNGLGVTRSLGCVRLTCENSKWIYDNCSLGTSVQIYEDPYIASPFDKPELIPISNQQTWDPSDPLFQ